MPEPKVTVPAGTQDDQVTPEVTAIAGQELDPVTPPSPTDLWKFVWTDCVQARQEVFGIISGMDGMPYLCRFPRTREHVLNAFIALRKAKLSLDDAISEIQCEIPDPAGDQD